MRNIARPTLLHERALWDKGYHLIAGLDEAGRGAWAGPVVAAAVILPVASSAAEELVRCGVTDSKQMTSRQRESCRDLIRQQAIQYAVGACTHTEIDEMGIMPATRLAMCRAIDGLSVQPEALIIDAVKLPTKDIPQDIFFHADAISLSVAAASILAKTYRDQMMCALDEQLPSYGFARHKGYGTAFHRVALAANGASWAHRRTYAPIRRLTALMLS